MPPEKDFQLSYASKEKENEYHHQILEVIKSKRIQARLIKPDNVLNAKLHENHFLDARTEIAEFEPIRRDICESFGVKFDDDHIYIHDYISSATRSPKIQRALRAFFVVVNLTNDEAYYGEGRALHNILFQGICDKVKQIDPDMDFELVSDDVEAEGGKFLVFKGFLSNKSFDDVDADSRKVLETPLFDQDHKIVETAKSWFLTGHNLD
jgi:hypothetical protein